jgi:hypothetical protein
VWVEYYFNELDPIKFQRLVNTILVARFGEDSRITPLRGKDGGRDGETAPSNPYYEYQVGEIYHSPESIIQPPRKGRYLFQVKFHQTIDKRLSDARNAVINDFKEELERNVLTRKGIEKVNYFILITNVPCSEDALNKVDSTRSNLINTQDFHADVWWKESLTAYLDQLPFIWTTFPEIFAGGIVPFLGKMIDQTTEGLPRAIRMAISHQYEQDKKVKFRQIELEQSLAKLFVDLDIQIQPETRRKLISISEREIILRHNESGEDIMTSNVWRYRAETSTLEILLDNDKYAPLNKVLLEGGPGQGKSTITQMAAQIYRQKITGGADIDPENRWSPPRQIRIPFRIELRMLAEWLSNNSEGSIEQYLAMVISRDSGGSEIKVEDIHTAFEGSSVILIFDGLDEIGNDNLRDVVLKKIIDSVRRFENDLKTDLRVIITTRPPAMEGRRNILPEFEQLILAPMGEKRIEEYVKRWLSVQVSETQERTRIRASYERRQHEPHVQALARNPMQLSVLLQLIRLKGEAFPDRRAELYREYFQIVIDRDVEKSPKLRENREVTEALHEFLGYNIHALTEVKQADRSLDRKRLIKIVQDWLIQQGREPEMAGEFFKLGEERFGLIVASKGEGEETKYGFEVQPVQEYFAAAFISNQISASSAHDFFESMISRPYWNEVALFLAGLRRPNEKVDLIARAKKVDQDKEFGWRQDGRAIILQLLQEGVFSEPRYVFSEALDYIFDLLDPEQLKIQREPNDLLASLEKLVIQNLPERHQERISKMLWRYMKCDDSYMIKRIYHIASCLLDADNLCKTVISYKGRDPYLVALVRLGWLYRFSNNKQIGKHIEQITREPSFWKSVPNIVWAQVWWYEACRIGIAYNLCPPPNIQQNLLELFATDQSLMPYKRSTQNIFMKTESNLAIWRLVRYQQMISLISIFKVLESESEYEVPLIQAAQEEMACVHQESLDLDYSGLDDIFSSVIRNIIQLSYQLITESATKKEVNHELLEVYLKEIRKYLKLPGLVGWIAYRCLVNVIPSVIPTSAEKVTSSKKREIQSLVRDLQPYYEKPPSTKLRTGTFSLNRLSFIHARRLGALISLESAPAHYYSGRFNDIFPSPNYIRKKSEGEFFSIIDLINNKIGDDKELPFKWLTTMSLPDRFIRPLIEQHSEHLPKFLTWLGENKFVPTRSSRKLRVQDSQRIIAIARKSKDRKILSGVATALMVAEFRRIAEPSVILKLVQATPYSQFATMLFPVILEKEYTLTKVSEKEVNILKEVAELILKSPEKYRFLVVCNAAAFLAEYKRPDLKPLIKEDKLQEVLTKDNNNIES